MSYYGYQGYGASKRKGEKRDFSEKAYQRKSLPEWDARWHALSTPARLAFLEHVKGPVRGISPQTPAKQPSAAADLFVPKVLEELVRAGFVQVETAADGRSRSKSKAKAKAKASGDRVFACDAIYDFATRLRHLLRYRLLATEPPGEFTKYLNATFYGGSIGQITAAVLRKVGIQDRANDAEMVSQYVMHHRWPGWVAQSLDDPLASSLFDAIRTADGPVHLADLVHQFKGTAPETVRETVDRLIVNLALVEDLDAETGALIVGFLPVVREELRVADQPHVRPSLVVVDKPNEIAIDGNLVANDLRAVLLEAVGDPPLLRQDHSLFQKETGRFLSAIEPLPSWLSGFLQWSPEARVNQALRWAALLDLVTEKPDINGKQNRLHVTTQGNDWLSGGLHAQDAAVFEILTAPVIQNEMYDPRKAFLYTAAQSYYDISTDIRFLGVSVTVMKAGKKGEASALWNVKPQDHDALRRALDQALGTMKPNTFYTLESLAAHLAFGEHNPIHLDLKPEQTTVYWGPRSIPPLEERREDAGRQLIERFIQRRLVPFGAMQTAVDGQGRIAVARTPRYDLFFGRKPSASASRRAAKADNAAKVVVQPDFSVILIGLNSAAAADLAPFCERGTHRSQPGAMVLKITREAVVKAVSQGLKPDEIAARLHKHATHDVPANVLREVREWSGWVRQVAASTLTVLRCPDRETADRIVGVLKKQAERFNDTTIALDPKTLNTTERNRLRAQGVLIQNQATEPVRKPVKKARRKRW